MKVSLARLKHGRRLNELIGLLLLFLAVVSLLSVLSYTDQDPNWFNRAAGDGPTRNWVGRVGANLSEALLQLLGVAAFLLPLALGAVGWVRLRSRPAASFYWKILGYGALGLSLAALMDLLYDPVLYRGERFEPGGALGGWTADAMVSVLNRPGAIVFSAALMATLIVLITRFSFATAAETIVSGAVVAGRKAGNWMTTLWERRRRALSKRVVTRRPATRREPEPTPAPESAEPPPPPEVRRRPSIPLTEIPEADKPAPRRAPAQAVAGATQRRPRQQAPAPRRQTTLPLHDATPGYALPPIHLLNEAEPQQVDNEKVLLERARQLTDKFREFAVDGSVVAIHPGPVVTTFEFKPDAGVKYSKITGMADDLCLALKAESVRIDRMQGRSTVGIEVPNRQKETIHPRELIDSERFRNCRSKLTLALGKDIGGEVFTAELDQMPHLLIAGATGAGKSVMLNGMIVSILYKATPVDVRFIMIDTKMIELGVYEKIPHLLVPVVTEPKQASTALKWAVKEMEDRYHKLASMGVRNIEQFNKLIAEEPDRTTEDEKGGEPIPLRHLPYIVIVVDELADVLVVSSADVEESVMRLAQMARAVGIHLLLATQRPSVDVITGTIKANFPSRIAFRVSQRVDSRTIIDQNGAERLLGRGDMLYLPSGSARLFRLHSGYITEPELNRLTAFLRKTARPVYDETVLREPEEPRPGFDADERDPMYTEAVRLVLQEGHCSITLIQRRLRLGYARAARLVDMMEQQGVVGPADGSRPRDLLVGPEVLETLEASHR